MTLEDRFTLDDGLTLENATESLWDKAKAETPQLQDSSSAVYRLIARLSERLHVRECELERLRKCLEDGSTQPPDSGPAGGMGSGERLGFRHR